MKIPLKDIIFVVVQILLIIAFTFEIESMKIIFPGLLFWLGVLLFILGALVTIVAVFYLNINLSPFPSPLPGAKLIETGMYRFARHPIYSGLTLAFFGYAIISDSGYKLFIATCLFLLFYFKSIYEEERLIEQFPNYSEYKNRTGRFFPWL